MDNLPHSLNSFVGRDQDVAKVANLMGASRLVTVTGPPGVGKTRLAVEVASRLTDIYPHGAWIVELTGMGDPAAVAPAVAAALGIHESAGGGDVAQALHRYLRIRRLLLVVDNAEHLLGATASLIEDLLRKCPDLSVLVTTREPLHLGGEQVFVTEPLALPVDDPGIVDDEAVLAPAVRLFVDRARAVRPGFAITAGTENAVLDICRRLDGLPLAIELAAARVATLSVQDIEARLADQLEVLVNGATIRDPRHRSLRLALEWSYHLLPVEEQRLLRRLSVFSGSFTIPAAMAVAGSEEPAVVAGLGALTQKSLVVADTSGPSVRYHLLETVRAFAADHLRQSGEISGAHDRHNTWYTTVSESAEERLSGPDQLTALDDLDADYPNLRTALQRVTDAGCRGDAERLAGGLGLYWRLRGRISEGKRWLEAALENDAGSAGLVPPGTRAAALWSGAFMRVMSGEKAGAVPWLESCLDLARRSGDRRREARALLLQGDAAIPSNYDLAIEVLGKSRAVATEIDDTWCMAHASALFGLAKMRTGDVAVATEALDAAVVTSRKARDLQGLRIALAILAELRYGQGRFKDAESLYNEVLDIARKLREPYALMIALRGLGAVALVRGELDRSSTLLEESIAAHQDPEPADLARNLTARGRLALEHERFDEAAEHYGEAVDILRAIAEPFAVAATGLSRALLACGDAGRARAVLDDALVSARGSSVPALASQVLNHLGMVDQLEGELDRASARFYEALDTAYQAGHLLTTVQSLSLIAGLALHNRRYSDAARLLAAAQAILASAGYIRPPSEQRRHDTQRAALMLAVGRDKFDPFWEEGSAMSVDEAVSYALRHHGTRGRPETGWASLTKTERKIVTLVARGMSNADIGAELFVSPRTVGNHLIRVYAKLGVNTRTQLALISRERSEEAPKNV